MTDMRQHTELECSHMLSYNATLVNIASFGPTWALIYAAQELVRAGYTDEEIDGRFDFAVSAERASQEHTDDE